MNATISPATIAHSAGIAHVQIASCRTAHARFFPPSYYDVDDVTVTKVAYEWNDIEVLCERLNRSERIGV